MRFTEQNCPQPGVEPSASPAKPAAVGQPPWTSPASRLMTVGTLMAVLAGCASVPLPPPPPPPAPPPAPVARPAPVPAPAPPPVVAPAPPAIPLAANWNEYRTRAARKIMAANPGATFSGKLPDPLQSIPVLQIQLNADGSIKLIDVMRVPRFAPETVQMAIAAIRRAAPFGPVTNLPHPWHFNETFLYNDDLKFQLRTLVEGQ